MVEWLGVAVDHPELAVCKEGGLMDALEKVFFGNMVAAGGGGKESAFFDKLKPHLVELSVCFEGAGHILAAFGEAWGIEDDKVK